MELQRQKVLLLGATGETGREILEGLLADENYVSSDQILKQLLLFNLL